MTVREAFLEQAAHCDGRSPLYARLCRKLAEDARTPGITGPEISAERHEPLLLLGGLHWLVLAGRASWDDVDGALDRESDFLRRFVAERSVQTNEVQRSYALLPGFLTIARKTGARTLDLLELGPSAGFNLLWDRYRYVYADGEWGPRDAPLVLTGEERRRVPRSLLAETVRVRRRVGVDLHPVDVRDDEQARLLQAWVWPDQTARLERLEAAIEAVRAEPPELVRGDYVEVLPKLLAQRAEDALTVVFETASRAYLTREERGSVREALEEAGAEAPLAWLATTSPLDADLSGYGLELRVWPGGERRIAAQLDFHGHWLDWLE